MKLYHTPFDIWNNWHTRHIRYKFHVFQPPPARPMSPSSKSTRLSKFNEVIKVCQRESFTAWSTKLFRYVPPILDSCEIMSTRNMDKHGQFVFLCGGHMWARQLLWTQDPGVGDVSFWELYIDFVLATETRAPRNIRNTKQRNQNIPHWHLDDIFLRADNIENIWK